MEPKKARSRVPDTRDYDGVDRSEEKYPVQIVLRGVNLLIEPSNRPNEYIVTLPGVLMGERLLQMTRDLAIESGHESGTRDFDDLVDDIVNTIHQKNASLALISMIQRLEP